MAAITATPDLATYPWFEVGTIFEETGMVGVSGQTGPNFTRRFQYNRPDGLFAIVTTNHYVTTEYREYDDDGRDTGERSEDPADLMNPAIFLNVMNRTEFMLCRDADDVGGSEVTSEMTYATPLDLAPEDHDDAVARSKNLCKAERIEFYHFGNGDL